MEEEEVLQQEPLAQEPPKKISPIDFAQSIKAKYPQYKDIEDSLLTQKIIEKYPVYKDKIDFSEKKNPDTIGSEPISPLQSLDSPVPMESTSSDISDPQPQKSKIDEGIDFAKNFARLRYEQGKDVLKHLASGTSETLAGLSGIPNFINKIKFNATLGTAKLLGIDGVENFEKTVNELPQDEREKLINSLDSMNNPISGALSQVSAAEQEALTNLSDTIKEKTKQYEGNIVDDITSGNIEQAALRAVNGMAESAPSLVLAAAPGGLLAIGAGTASQKQERLEREGEDLDTNSIMNSIVNGTAEGFFEKATAGLLKPLKGVLKGNKELAQQFSESFVTNLFKSVGIEASSEAATEISQQLSDAYFMRKEDEEFKLPENFWKNVADAGLIGGLMGGGISTATIASKRILEPEKSKAIDVAKQRVNEIDSELQTDIPDNLKEELRAVKSDLEGKIDSETQSAFGKFKSLPKEERIKLGDLENQLDQIKNEHDAIKENPNISEESKKVLLENKVNQAKELLASKQSIINAESKEETAQTTEQEVDGTTSEIEIPKTQDKAITEVFDENKELENIGTKNQYYNYLKSIFPNSQVNDILYHGSESVERFDTPRTEQGFFLTPERIYAWGYGNKGHILKALVDVQNPSKPKEPIMKHSLVREEGTDAIMGREKGTKNRESVVMFDPNKIHILGSKKDIEGFINWKNETAQSQNTPVDGNVQPTVGEDIQQRQDNAVQPTVEPQTGTTEAQPIIKKVKSKGFGNTEVEYDVEMTEDGRINKIISPKDGREIPRFTERTLKNGKKKLVKNGNFSKIESDVLGTKTNNQVAKERKENLSRAIESFESNDLYEKALEYFAKGGTISTESARKETGFTENEVKWVASDGKIQANKNLKTVEQAAESLDSENSQDARNALIQVMADFKNRETTQDEFINRYNDNTQARQEEELRVYKNSLSSEELANLEAIEAEDNYISELTDEEAIQYFEQEYESRIPTDDQIGEIETPGVQERQGTDETQEQSKLEKSKLDDFISFLDKADADLKKFGDETLGVNLPISIARTAVKAMMVAAKTAKTVSEVVQAGLKAIQSSQWYQRLNDSDKLDINEKTLEGMLRETINEVNSKTSEQAKKETDAMFEKSEKALENKKPFKERKRKAIRGLIKKFTDRQFISKKLVDEAGMQTVKDLMINSHGASGKAKRLFEDAYKKIYSKLSDADRKSLDQIIQLKRFISIDNYRADKENLPEITHPDFIDGVTAERALEQYQKELGKEKFDDLTKRANEYFKTYKGLLDAIYKEGLITKETYDSLSGLDYQPRLFLQHITDFEGSVSLGSARREKSDTGGLSEEQIKSLDEGSSGSLVTNSEWLLSTSIVGRLKSIATNKTNKEFVTKAYPEAKKRFDELQKKEKSEWTREDKRFDEYFRELDSKVKINRVIGNKLDSDPKLKKEFEKLKKFTYIGKLSNKAQERLDYLYELKRTPIYSLTKTPKNFKAAYYFENGVQKKFYLEESLHDSWFNAIDGIFTPGTREKVSYFSLSALLKGIATGNNPAFAIVNTPRDFLFTSVFSKEYSDFVPKAMMQVAKDSYKAIKEIRSSKNMMNEENLLSKYIEYGGDMAFLSTQGRLKKESWLGGKVDKLVSKRSKEKLKNIFDAVTLKDFSTYSEIMFRVALFKRTIQNQLKEKGFNSIDEITDQSIKDQIYNRAVANARSLLDFNQGGAVTKDLEALIPYVNTAVQGTRVAADAFSKDPATMTFRTMQAGVLGSSFIAGMSLLAINMLKGEEDKDKPAAEIYLDAMQGISKYQKAQYFNIVTGRKNEDGEYEVLKIAKNHQLIPVFTITDNLTENVLRKISGKETKDYGKISMEAFDAFNTNISPVSLTSPAENFTRNPITKAIMTYATGYDFYRDEPLANNVNKVPRPLEGQTMKSVEDFYKDLGKDYNLSPVRVKGAVESFITTPSTNPFIGMLYGGADAISSDKTMKEAGSKFVENIMRSTVKRVVTHTSDFNRSLNESEKYTKEEEKLKIKEGFNLIDQKDLAKRYTEGKISIKEYNKELQNFEPLDRVKIQKRVKDYKKLSNVVNRNILDIKYASSSRLKALMILNRYGDVFDGSKENLELLKQMKLAGGILTEPVILEYTKLKNEVSKKD